MSKQYKTNIRTTNCRIVRVNIYLSHTIMLLKSINLRRKKFIKRETLSYFIIIMR
jgi:hypothetical protein